MFYHIQYYNNIEDYGYTKTTGSSSKDQPFSVGCILCRLADAHNIETVPAFLLLHKGHELWRQVGELTVEELKDVLDDFR